MHYYQEERINPVSIREIIIVSLFKQQETGFITLVQDVTSQGEGLIIVVTSIRRLHLRYNIKAEPLDIDSSIKD